MSPAAALLTGLTMAFGLVLLGSGAPGRRAPRLLTRLDPYLRGLEPRSTQLLETEEVPLVSGGVPAVAGTAAGVLGLLGGVLGRDWRLTQQVERRQARMLEELPALADLICLAVTAGEAPRAAIERVVARAHGELSRELGLVLADLRAGAPFVAALERLAARVPVPQVVRFVDGLVVAVERGTPLADVLRAQATDVREQHKRELIEAGGRREVYMLVPVVFMLMPVVVLFALYPGFLTLIQIAR